MNAGAISEAVRKLLEDSGIRVYPWQERVIAAVLSEESAHAYETNAEIAARLAGQCFHCDKPADPGYLLCSECSAARPASQL